jgi:hypothetical protein
MTQQQEEALIRRVEDIHLAVIGDQKLGVSGLVNRMGKMEKWRNMIDLRIMAISGFVAGAASIVKHFLTKS